MGKTYRTKNSVIVMEIVIFIALVVFLIAGVLYVDQRAYSFLAGFTIVFILVAWIFSSIKRNRITIDEKGISGITNRKRFAFSWFSIKAVSIDGKGSGRQLVLGTEEGFVHIELVHLNVDDIWEDIKTRLPPEVFYENAYKNISGYKQWQEESTQFINQLVDSIAVQYYRIEKIFGWVVSVVGLSLTVYLHFRSLQELALTIVLVFVTPGIILILCATGKVEADSNKIVRQTIFGRYAIQWDEIREVVVTYQGDAMSLIGDNKRLVIPGMGKWYGERKEEIVYLVQSKIELANITVRRSTKPTFSLSKNTRVKL